MLILRIVPYTKVLPNTQIITMENSHMLPATAHYTTLQFMPDMLTHYFNHINYTLINPNRGTNLGSCDSSHIMIKSICRILSNFKARKGKCFLWTLITVSHRSLHSSQQFINSRCKQTQIQEYYELLCVYRLTVVRLQTIKRIPPPV